MWCVEMAATTRSAMGGRPACMPPDQSDGRYFPTELGPAAPVGAERDVYDGGAGTDTLGYEGRRRGVVADLARTDRHAGARGERDSLRGLERLEGGNGGDRLLGDDSANALLGGEGDDLLIGRGGDDELELGAGSNRARGGAGDDTIGALRANLLEPQRVTCGGGRDRVADLFRNDLAQDDCESVRDRRNPRGQVATATGQRGPNPPLASYTTSPADCLPPSCTLRLEVGLAALAQPPWAPFEGAAAWPGQRDHPPSRHHDTHRTSHGPRQPAPAPLSRPAHPHPPQYQG